MGSLPQGWVIIDRNRRVYPYPQRLSAQLAQLSSARTSANGYKRSPPANGQRPTALSSAHERSSAQPAQRHMRPAAVPRAWLGRLPRLFSSVSAQLSSDMDLH